MATNIPEPILENENPIIYSIIYQNYRPEQEDTLKVTKINDDIIFAGIFDGHGGSIVSKHCANCLPSLFEKYICETPNDILLAINNAYKECDSSINSENNESGSTALCVLLTVNKIWVANVGDCRVVKSSSLSNECIALSEDHKPKREDEQKRIIDGGGLIFYNGGLRVMGVLNITRAIGDYHLKQYGITAIPEVKCFDISENDEFIIIASDGLWNNLSTEDVINLTKETISRAIYRGVSRKKAIKIAITVLLKASIEKGSTDNISIIIIDI